MELTLCLHIVGVVVDLFKHGHGVQLGLGNKSAYCLYRSVTEGITCKMAVSQFVEEMVGVMDEVNSRLRLIPEIQGENTEGAGEKAGAVKQAKHSKQSNKQPEPNQQESNSKNQEQYRSQEASR